MGATADDVSLGGDEEEAEEARGCPILCSGLPLHRQVQASEERVQFCGRLQV